MKNSGQLILISLSLSLVIALTGFYSCSGSGKTSDTDSTNACTDCDESQMPDDPIDKWVQTAGPPTGADEHIEADPVSGALYAAGFGGTLFRSTDGSIWSATGKITDPYRKIIRLLFDPEAAGTFWVLAEAVPELVGSTGKVYVSTDSAQTWAEKSPGNTVALGNSPTVGKALIACDFEGMVYITEDGGATAWKQRPLPSGPDSEDKPPYCNDVAAGAAGEFWVTTSWSEQIFYTADSGANWDAVSTIPIGEMPPEAELGDILVDPNDTNRVYIAFRGDGVSFEAPGLIRTDNSGTDWTPLMVNFLGGPLGLPLLHAATDTVYFTAGNELFSSTDRGSNWSRVIGGGLVGEVRFADPVDIAVDSDDVNTLYMPTKGHGIAKSIDGGQNWSYINTGLHAAKVSWVALLHEPPGGLLVDGWRDVFRSFDWGQTWQKESFNFGPSIDEFAVDAINPQRIWIASDLGDMYASENGGDTFDLIYVTCSVGQAPCSGKTSPTSGFRYGSIYAMTATPGKTDGSKDRLYAIKAGYGIWRSDDDGTSWTYLRESNVDYTYTLAVDPSDSDIMYAGHNPKPFETEAVLRRTQNGGDAFDTSLTVSGATSLSSIVIDPSNPANVYAAFATDSGAQLHRSTDKGDNWEQMDPPSFANVHAMDVHPADPSYAIAALWGGGLFYTQDKGLTWQDLEAPTISASAVMLTNDDTGHFFIADRSSPRIFEAYVEGQTPLWSELFNAGSSYYRVITAALAPSDTDVIYASIFKQQGQMGGSVFRIDSGIGTDISAGLPMPAIALTVHPTDPDIIYACLHGAGSGVYKTSNGGTIWNKITDAGSGIPQTPAIGFFGATIDPNDTDTVYLFGGSAAFLGPNGIEQSAATDEWLHTVYKSTDGGVTWNNTNDGNLGSNSGAVKGLAIHPGNSDLLFAGAAKGVFYSSNGGSTWARADTSLSYKHMGGMKIASDGSTLFGPTLGDGVHVANLDDTTFDATWANESTLTTPVYHVQVAVHPSDGSTLYLSSYPGGVFKSTDGGDTWFEQNFGLPTLKVDDPIRQGYYAMTFAPSDPDIIYLAIYGRGIYRSEDGGGTWRMRNGSAGTMAGATVSAVTISSTDTNHVWAATEDGVFLSSDGGANWSVLNDGLDNPDVRTLVLLTNGDLIAGTRGNENYRLTSESSTWTQTPAFSGLGTFWDLWNRPMYQYTSVIFHPTDPKVIFIGTFPAGIFKTEDGGKTWRERNVGFTNDGIFFLTFHPDDPDIIYAGTYNGVNRSTDGGDHWQVWDEGWPDEQWVFSIVFDPRDANVMYACSKDGSNKGAGIQADSEKGIEGHHGTVMKSTNGGKNWTKIFNGLSDQEYYAMVVDPVNPDTIYLSGQRAVYVSSNGGTSWQSFDEGLDNPFPAHPNNVTSPLKISPDGKYLYLGTQGSGVYRRRLRQ